MKFKPGDRILLNNYNSHGLASILVESVNAEYGTYALLFGEINDTAGIRQSFGFELIDKSCKLLINPNNILKELL